MAINDFRLILPEHETLYNPNLRTEADIRAMDAEEVWHFNSCGELLDTVEELLELLKGEGYDYDINEILLKVLFLKSKMGITAIPV